MVRVLFDTTVLVSAFLTPKGVAGELLDLAGSDFELVLGNEILEEARLVLLERPRLRQMFGYADDAVSAYLTGLQRLAMMVAEVQPEPGVVRDPADDIIVATAKAGGVAYLVTRDRDLLDLGTYDSMQILTPEVFRGMLRNRSQE